MRLIGFIIRIYHDARSAERQTLLSVGTCQLVHVSWNSRNTHSYHHPTPPQITIPAQGNQTPLQCPLSLKPSIMAVLNSSGLHFMSQD